MTDKYSVIYKSVIGKNELKVQLIEADKIEIIPQMNSLVTARFISSFSDTIKIITNVHDIQRRE